jgi:YopJ family protease
MSDISGSPQASGLPSNAAAAATASDCGASRAGSRAGIHLMCDLMNASQGMAAKPVITAIAADIDNNNSLPQALRGLRAKLLMDMAGRGFPIRSWRDRQFLLEEEVLPLLVKVENLRKPGLRLNLCSNLHQVVADLKTRLPMTQSRYVLPLLERKRVSKPDFSGADLHHVTLDIMRIDEASLSVLLFDSIRWIGVQDEDILLDFLQPVFPKVALACFPLGVLKAAAGCKSFSIDLALKAYEERDAIQALHRSVINKAVGFSVEANSLSTYGMKAAQMLLPARMFKHAQSTGDLEELVERRPELMKQAVNKKGQSLLSRRESHVLSGGNRWDSLTSKTLVKLDRAERYLLESSKP